MAYVSGDLQASTENSWVWQGSETGMALNQALGSASSIDLGPGRLTIPGPNNSATALSEAEKGDWGGWERVEYLVQMLMREGSGQPQYSPMETTQTHNHAGNASPNGRQRTIVSRPGLPDIAANRQSRIAKSETRPRKTTPPSGPREVLRPPKDQVVLLCRRVCRRADRAPYKRSFRFYLLVLSQEQRDGRLSGPRKPKSVPAHARGIRQRQCGKALEQHWQQDGANGSRARRTGARPRNGAGRCQRPGGGLGSRSPL